MSYDIINFISLSFILLGMTAKAARRLDYKIMTDADFDCFSFCVSVLFCFDVVTLSLFVFDVNVET